MNKYVSARAAGHGIVSVAANKRIIASAANKHIRRRNVRVANQRIVACAAFQRGCGLTCLNRVVLRVALDINFIFNLRGVNVLRIGRVNRRFERDFSKVGIDRDILDTRRILYAVDIVSGVVEVAEHAVFEERAVLVVNCDSLIFRTLRSD